MGDGRILERTCKVPVIDTNEIHFIEIMTTINTLLGVASSIQAFYLPGEEPLPIGRFFFLLFLLAGRKVHCLATLGSYNNLLRLIHFDIPILEYTGLVQKTGAAEMGDSCGRLFCE